ncbi:IPT/TIG domain-containing protein [Bacteroides xylanisolvens]|nr:IPT/TIG domain-containing protein [Bacteroides xylanisolvens]
MTSAGSSIEIKGVNLTQVDSVFVGEYKAEITKRATDVLTCQLSAEYEVTGTKKITLYYYDETNSKRPKTARSLSPKYISGKT